MIELRYVGRIKESGEIFDLTEEDVAKEENVFNSRIDYGPVYILLGEGEVIEGLEEVLINMEPGGEKEVGIPSDKAFGERDSGNIKTFSARKFRNNDVKPNPGSIVEINGKRGRIIYSGSGRVKVDFNNPLSGKDLKYWLKVEKFIKGEEKARKIVQKRLSDEAEIELNEGRCEIDLPDEVDIEDDIKEEVIEDLKNYVKGIETVEIS